MDENEKLERLKSALWYSIGRIIDDETLETNCNATPQFIGALTELIWTQLESAAKDMESFAKHAGRGTVTTEDVMLLTRRNEGLEAVLRGILEEQRQQKGNAGGSRAGRR